MMAARVRALITLHTVCSMEPNKLKCQSQTHLGARSCISGCINQWYWGWMGTWHCDRSPPSADKVRRVWCGVNLIIEWEWLTLPQLLSRYTWARHWNLEIIYIILLQVFTQTHTVKVQISTPSRSRPERVTKGVWKIELWPLFAHNTWAISHVSHSNVETF